MAQEDTTGVVTRLFSDPAHWCKHSLANLKDGTPTTVSDPEAFAYCLVGAILKCYPNSVSEKIDICYSQLKKRGRKLTPVGFNNQSDHATVLAFCKENNL